MKTPILTLLVFFAFFSISRGQGAMDKGNVLVNVGLGLNGYYGGLPIDLSVEKAVSSDWSLGASIDYTSYTWQNSYYINGPYSFTALYLGVRAAYHLNKVLEKLNASNDKLDVYIGASLGYVAGFWSQNYIDYWRNYYNLYGYYGGGYYYNYGSGLFWGLYVGGKYYFTNHLGAFVELGAVGSTNARIGLAVKF